MTYKVWYGYAIKSFTNKSDAVKFARQNDGVVIEETIYGAQFISTK